MMNYNLEWLWNCHSDDHQNPILHKPVPMKHYHWNFYKNDSIINGVKGSFTSHLTISSFINTCSLIN